MAIAAGNQKTKQPDMAKRIRQSLAHPLRAELMRYFAEGVWSATELASTTGRKLGDVSYHVRELAKAGAIEFVDRRFVRGATEKYYRGLCRSEVSGEEWEAMSLQERSEVSESIIRNTFSEIYQAAGSGTMDSRINRHLSWRPVTLDEEGWNKLADLVTETLRKAEEIEAESAGRRARSGSEDSMTAVVALQCFERGTLA